MSFDEACNICKKKITNADNFACIKVVYGYAGNYLIHSWLFTNVIVNTIIPPIGDGKTHYIKQHLQDNAESLIIAVNEAFTPLNTIKKLRSLPSTHRGCAIFFNFTILPPGVGLLVFVMVMLCRYSGTPLLIVDTINWRINFRGVSLSQGLPSITAPFPTPFHKYYLNWLSSEVIAW